jgi:hypothetical protein
MPLISAARTVLLVPAGLWYILLIAFGLCFVLTLIHNARKDPSSTTGGFLRKAAAAIGIGDGQPPAAAAATAGSAAAQSGAPVARRHGGSAAGGSAMSSMDGFEHGTTDGRAEGHTTLKAFLGVSTFAYRWVLDYVYTMHPQLPERRRHPGGRGMGCAERSEASVKGDRHTARI